MIPRYSRPEMVKIWLDENRYQIWLEIETYALEAFEELGSAPKGSAKEVWAKGKFDVKRIMEIEETTKHDVIAFLTNLAESVGEVSRFIHSGMTSSDVLDTCLSKQLSQASDILITDLFVNKVAFTALEVDSLKQKKNGGKRLVISYMSIGEAEDYRYYWQSFR